MISKKTSGQNNSFFSGVSRGVLWVLKHPARADPKKKEEGKKRKRRKEGKKRRKRRKERKQASDNEKYLSPLPSLNGFQISRHGPIRRTPQQF